ncbi:MAG: anhydro-N-acetylmuramic acid kinase, partial [candidate division Zixibacteria bacterium]|nr:anhydro-N-acetylmuramic acid kinase [candidate division Zixibacteria bacterium]
KKESRLIVNIGGMSNYFYFPWSESNLPVSAADCGPGNCLSDILADQLFSIRYDRGGRRAASGELSTRLLTLLMGDSFFTTRAGSTGRESFGPEMVRKMIDFGNRFGKPAEDLLRTAAELTTNSIVRKVWPIIRRDRSLSKLYLTGGGRHNSFFVKRLRHHLPDLEILPADELGYDADSVEALAFAVMGEACLRSEPLSSTGTGASNRNLKTVLGRISQPPILNRKK